MKVIISKSIKNFKLVYKILNKNGFENIVVNYSYKDLFFIKINQIVYFYEENKKNYNFNDIIIIYPFKSTKEYKINNYFLRIIPCKNLIDLNKSFRMF